MHAPIHGSIINPRARLYKRITVATELSIPSASGAGLAADKPADGNAPLKVTVKDIIRCENNYYRYAGFSFPFVEASDREDEEYSPLTGLQLPGGSMTIKFNGRYRPDPSDPCDPQEGDVLDIGGELWMIEGAVQRARIKSLRGRAVVYLTLRKAI